jgi:hypothetical protein
MARGLGRCTAEQAGMIKALLLKGYAQDVSAWLVGVNGGRANDVHHARRFAAVGPAPDAILKAFLQKNAQRFALLVATT